MLHPSLQGARACIFDAGGTLIHPDWPRLAALAAEVTGRDFAPGDLERALKEILREFSLRLQQGGEHRPEEKVPHWMFRRMYCSLGVDEGVCERVIERLEAAHAERHMWCGLDPNAARVIDELKRAGLTVAVISNTEDGRARDALEAAGVADKFDLLIDSYVVGMRKPDARIFHLALEQLGLAPAEAVYVGDSYAMDALPALAVGMRAVLLDPLDLHPESVAPRVRTLGELINAAP